MAPRASITKAAQRQAARDEKATRKAAVDGAITKAEKVNDSFQNFALNIGQGTGNALSMSSYGFNPLTRFRTYLEWMYRGSAICGVAVDAIAEDMTKLGIEMSGLDDSSHPDELKAAMANLNIWGELGDGKRWSRLYGGALCVMLIDGQDLSTPLRVETIGKDMFKGLVTLDRWMVEPSINDLVSEFGPHMGKPKFYRVIDDAHVLRRQSIHFSRVVRFSGYKLPYWQAVSENLWGTSVLERLYDRLVAFDSATAGTAQMLHKQHIRTYKIDGLREILGSGGPLELALQKMLFMMKQMQSNEGLTVIDGKDDFQMGNINASSGMVDALTQFGQQIAGAIETPMVRLFGMAPAGLNATGESDMQMYADTIEKKQESELRVPLTTILMVMAQSLGIKLDMKKFNFHFVSLRKMTEDERAAVASADTKSVLETYQAGLVEADEALDELARRGRLTGRWSILTQEVIDRVRTEGPPGPQLEPGAGAAENALLGEGGGSGKNPNEATGGPAKGGPEGRALQ